jgi:hypothetical protein
MPGSDRRAAPDGLSVSYDTGLVRIGALALINGDPDVPALVGLWV